MAIDVRCKTCGQTLPTPDEYAGQKVRCGGCDSLVDVPANAPRKATVAVARRRREDDDDDDDDRPARKRKPAGGNKSLAIILILVGVAAFVFLPIAAIGFVIFNEAAAPPNNGFGNANGGPGPMVMPPGAWPPGGFGGGGIAGAPAGPPIGIGPEVASAKTEVGLVGLHRDNVVLEASSEWQGGQWSVASAFDGNDATSWFAFPSPDRKEEWVRVTFPEDVTVKRVKILANREVPWSGYQIAAGTIELFDDNDQLIDSKPMTGDAKNDFLWNLPLARGKVRSVKFTITKGKDGSLNVGIGEFIVE